MTHSLLSAPQSFFTAPTVGQDRTLSRWFGQVKMSFVPKHKGSRLLVSHNGSLRNVTIPVKAEHNCSNTCVDDEVFDSIPDNGGNRVEDYEAQCVYIWWDFGRCPLPLNFDASKIGNTIIDAVRRINEPGVLFFRGYGNLGQLYPKMGEETLRILLESEFPLIGFQMIDDVGPYAISDENIMKADLLHTVGRGRWGKHMVVMDSTSSTACALDELRGHGYEMIAVHPEQDATEGVWHWKPLLDSVTGCQLSAGHKAKVEHDELNGRSIFPEDRLVTYWSQCDLPVRPLPLTFLSEEIVNIWWEIGRCPLPSNIDSRKIGSNITKALQRININGPIYLRVYGIIAEMGKEVARLIREPGFQLMGFLLKDYNDAAYLENLMMMDALMYSSNLEPPCIHMFISDGNEQLWDVSDILREEGYTVIKVHPESKASDGAWRWEPLLASGVGG